MINFLMILAVLIAVVLMASVLIQNPKGSGLAANFSSGNQFFGVKKTTDIVEKITWVTAGLVMFISLVVAGYNPKTGATDPNAPTQQGGKIDPQLEEIMQKGGAAPAVTNPFNEEQAADPNQPQVIMDEDGSGGEFIFPEEGNN